MEQFNKAISISEDEKIARNILNLCSDRIEVTEEFLLFLETVKSRHLLLAKKMLKDTNVLNDMVLFEYLIDNISNADDFEDDEVFF